MDVKRFLKNLLLFSVPFLLLIPVVEYGLSTIPNSYNKKKKALESQLDSIEVLVLGSSHTTYSIDPDYFTPKAFNLANVNQSLYYDKELTLRYLPRMPKLKQVIIPISYFSLYYRVADTKEEWRAYFYDKVWHIPVPDGKFTDLPDYSYIKLYYPLSMKYTLGFFRTDLAPGMKHNGFIKNDTTFFDEIDTPAINRVNTVYYSRSRDLIYQQITGDLEELVSALHKRNIRVTFITTPILAGFSRYFNQEILSQNRAIVSRMCQKYDCQYYNYQDDQRFERTDFSDYGHFNYLGAAKFSKILNKEVLDSLAH